MGKHYDSARDAVQAAIENRKVLTAYDSLRGQETTVGPYTEAVDRGFRFAVIGCGRAGGQSEHRTARDAAERFVDLVGHTRAREAARSAT